MLKYLLNRILLIIPTAFGVVVLAFLLIHLVPGDPVEVLLGEQAVAADREALRHALGLDLPLGQQFWQFFQGLLVLDLGTSFYNGKDVVELISSRIGATAWLAVCAMGFALLLAIPLGFWAAIHQGKWQDKTALVFSMAAFSMPSFWLGPMLIILFSLWLGWLPISGNEGLTSVILPAVTLGAGMAAMTARLLRSSLLEAMSSDYIKTAKAKGISHQRAITIHALRNALLPITTVIFLQAGALLTGAILTEAVFSWPGVGSLIVESINRRDYAVVQGVVLFIAFVYMVMTLLSDIFCAILDPRVRG